MSRDLIPRLKRALTVKLEPEQAPAAPAMPSNQDRARPSIRTPVAIGFITLVVFFGGFGAWAGLAPLSSAAIAPGAVRVEDYRKTVQHLEGGIIHALNVRDGDRVAQGERLIVLDKTQARARFKAQLAQFLTLKAEQARLIAERDARAHIDFPPSLLARARHHPQVAERLKSQRRIFQSRRRTLKGRIEILHQRIAQLRLQSQGLGAQVDAEARQLDLISEEIKGVQALYAQGLEGNAHLLELKRSAAALHGSRAGHLSAIAQAKQKIGETRLEMLTLKREQDAEVASALRDIQASLGETQQALRAAQDVLKRTDIRAPISGVVMNLHYFTTGGIIEPGGPILDIVPQREDLVVEVQISPLDIDVVKPGLDAQVRLTAYKQRTTPVLAGRVTYVSADSLTDETKKSAYYKALIQIKAKEHAKLEGVPLYPGMPVDGIILTGQRTFWRYLVAPLQDSFAHAFREQ